MRWLSVIFAAALSGSIVYGAPAVAGVSNAASGGDISPGCLFSIYGTNLADATAIAGSGNLPTKLGGSAVSIGGIAAPLLYVSPTQINAQVPFEVAPGPSTLTVTTAESASAPFNVSNLHPTSPAVFRLPNVQGQALLLTPEFHLANTIRSGDVIIFYATGLGQTNPPAATGAPGAMAAPFNELPSFPSVSIGGNPAKVLFAGMAPGFAVYQINVLVPDLPLNDQIQLATTDNNADAAQVAFANNNVSNVQASVNLVYPSTSSQLTFSPIPLVATYSVHLDVSASAKPFRVTASIVGSNAISFFTANPAEGTLTGLSAVPTLVTRVGDFSLSGLLAWDFLSGSPFPADIVPVSRLDPALLAAYRSLPPGTAPGSDRSIFTYEFSGTITPGAPFSFDPTTPGAQFGGFLSLSQDPHKINVGTLMFVDGVRIAGPTVPISTL